MDFISYHSNWALAVLALLVIAIANSLIGLISKKSYSTVDKKIFLYAVIGAHIQFLLGIVTYMMSPKTQAAMSDFGAAMNNSDLRLYAVEHPLMLLIGIIVITLGFSKAKRAASDTSKFKTIFIYYLIGTILIASRIPWSQWGH